MLGALTIGRLGLAGLAAGGAFLAHDAYRFFGRHDGVISQGGSPHGTITGKLMGFRHVLAHGLRNAFTHPRWMLIAFQAERDARLGEAELFFGGRHIGYDNGTDAYRHAYGSALIMYRIMRDGKATPAEALAYSRGGGIAHEQDSFLRGPHYHNSRAMDLINNELGYRIALEQARVGLDAGGDERVRLATLDAIRAGRAIVLDHVNLPPRRSRPGDLAAPYADAPGYVPLRPYAGLAPTGAH